MDALDALCVALDTNDHDHDNDSDTSDHNHKDDRVISSKECGSHTNVTNTRKGVSREDVERVLGGRSGSNGIGSLALRKTRNKTTAPETSTTKRRRFEDVGQGAMVVRYSGLKIRHALVSSSQLESIFHTNSFIKLNQVKMRAVQDTIPTAWCSIGVVGEVSVVRMSSQNTPYVVWKLTDLNETMVLLYVFGDAFEEFRDAVGPGSLVALVSPKKRCAAGAVTLSVDSYRQLLMLGESADFGYCSEVTKDGRPCRVPVNVNVCGYCAHHVTKAYNKIRSKRLEIQGGNLGTAFKRGVAKMAWKVGNFDATSLGGGTKKPTVQDMSRVAEKSNRLGSMGSKYLVTCADPRKAWELAREEDLRKKTSGVIPQKHMPRVVCGGSGRQQKGQSFDGTTRGEVCLEDTGSGYAAELSSVLPPRAQAAAMLKDAKRENTRTTHVAPFLASGLDAYQKKKEKSVSYPTQEQKGKKKTKTVHHHHRENVQQNAEQSSFEKLFGQVIDEMQDRVAEDGHVHSTYKNVVDAGRDHELMQTLDVLEKKDAMAEKMDSIKKLKVSGWKCSVCNVTLSRKHPQCMKDHPQALQQVATEKRWWKCSDCQKTFSTLGVKYPTDACMKCGSKQSHFESQSMKRDMSKAVETLVTDGVACRENMLARGREQKWVNE